MLYNNKNKKNPLKNNILNILHQSDNKKDTIPGSFEIDTLNYFSMVKEQMIRNEKQLNDLKVYSKIISMILSLQPKFFDNDYYVSMIEIQKICEEEFKNLSKNWKD